MTILANLFDAVFVYRGSIMFAVVVGMVFAFAYTRPAIINQGRAKVAAVVQPEPAAKSPEGAPQSVVARPVAKKAAADTKARPRISGIGYIAVRGEIKSFHKLKAGDDMGERIIAKIHNTKTGEWHFASLPLAVRTITEAQVLFPPMINRRFDLLFMGRFPNDKPFFKLMDADGVNVKPAWDGL